MLNTTERLGDQIMIQLNLTHRIGKSIPLIMRSLYIASIFLAVIQFGAVRPIPVSLSTIFACVVAVASLAVYGAPNRGRWLFLTVLFLGMLTFAWVWLQSVQFLPASFDNPLWGDLSIASLPVKGSISVTPADSIETLLFVAVPLLAFLTGMVVIRSDDDARMIINALALGGAACSLYGLVQVSFFPETTLFFTKVFYLDSVTGTFGNRNTAGTFFGLAALAMLRYLWSMGNQISVGRMMLHLLANRKVDAKGLFSFLRLLFFLGCCVLALMLTKSRGAMASSFVAMCFLFYFLYVRGNAAEKAGFSSTAGKNQLIRGLVSLAALFIVLLIFGGRTLLRTQTQGAEDGRYCILPSIMEFAGNQPTAGYGFGSFVYAFPPFREPDCGLLYVWDRAHNVYLEGLTGLGIIFPPLVLIGIGALLIAHIIGLRERRRMKPYAAMGIAVILLIALHSLVDFSIEIPGLAAYAAGLIAATASISLGRSGPRMPSQDRSATVIFR